MSSAQILKFDQLPVVERGGGIATVPLVGAGAGSRAIATGITRFPPGAAIPLHTHNVEEAVTVLEGEAIVEIEGRQEALRPYDTTFVPAEVPHRFLNAGRSRMAILWCYGGTRVTRTFVASGETVEQLSEEDRVG